MQVRKILLTNFRNHTGTSLEFDKGANIIAGPNAQGKTGILESISYVCLTKSFLQQADSAVCRKGAASFAVDATMESDHGIERHVRVSYETEKGKTYLLDDTELRKSAAAIGLFPIVVLSPWDFVLTSRSPSERRKFLDIILSQTSRAYLEELVEYRRALKQRNKVLTNRMSVGVLDKGLLDAWTHALVDHGTKVTMKRKEFMKDFQEDFTVAYATLVEDRETPRLVYEPSFQLADEATAAEVGERFYRAVGRLDKVERARGCTLVGPHRDDIGFLLNGAPIREFASQGQHKTFLVALKIAEYHFMKSRLNETPMMLLDDVMTELDYERATRTIQAILPLGQTFITVTDTVNFADNLLGTAGRKVHFVKDGNVVYDAPSAMFGAPSATGSVGVGNG